MQRHAQAPSAALSEVPAGYLDWEQQDYQEALEGIERGYASIRAGRGRPAAEFFGEMRRKHGIPG